MTRIVILLAALVLAGCNSAANLPVPAQCNPLCFQPCTVGTDTGVRWEANPADPAAWDALAGDVVPELADKLLACETHRQACGQCLQRLDKARVIKITH